MTTNNFYPKTDIQIGNAFELIHNLKDNSVDCIVTSPPYYNLRNYETEPIIFDSDPNCNHEWIEEITKLPNSQGGNSEKTNLSRKGKDNFQAFTEYHNRTVSSDFCQKCGAWKGQLGLEPTPELFISHLTQFFNSAKSKLKHEGNLFVNLGDTYGTQSGTMLQGFNHPNGNNKLKYDWLNLPMIKPKTSIVRHKNLCLIPERFAIAMCDEGWILRNKIIWHKSNNMPECLSPETQIFIKQNDLVFRKTMQYLFDKKDNLSNIKILSHNGWKDIINVWETYKSSYTLNLSNVEKIQCSEKHKFLVGHDIRRKHIEDKTLLNIRNKNDWLLYKSIEEYMPNTQIYLDCVQLLNNKKEKLVYIYGDSTLIKNRKTNGKPTWEILSNRYGYKVIKRPSGYDTNLKRLMLKNFIPCHVAIGENYNYDKDTLISPKSNGEFPTLLKLDYNIGYLIGLFVAEGGITNNNRGRGTIKLTFHRKETNLIDFVVKECDKYKINCRLYTKNNYTSVNFNSLTLSAILTFFAPNKCVDKKLNIDYILNTPLTFRKGLLNGAVDGDGHKRNNGFTYTSASHQLACDIKTLCSSVGISCGLIKTNQYDKRTNKTYYSTIIYTSFINRKKRYDKTIGIYPRDITPNKNKIKMIDIEVEDNYFIIGDGLISHNSVSDRLTKAHEVIYHFVKQDKYYYDLDAIRIPHATESIERYQRSVNLGANSITGKISQREEQNTGVPRKAPKWFRENDKPYSVQERTKETVEYRENLPPLSDLKTYLSTVKNKITIDEIESIFGNQAPHHWFSGESYPSSSDWMKLKSILNFDDTFDFVMTNTKTKSSEKQNNPLGKNPTDYHEIENNYDINELIAKWKELHPEDWNNPTDIWNISTKGYSGAHFATFPLKLIERPILAGCPPQGTVLDPFGGSGTVGEFCRFNNRNSIIFELNDSYKPLIIERTKSNSPHLLSFI